jgi:hypothetical protein
MNTFKSATSVGATQAFVIMEVLYFVSMMIGALAIRVPAEGWKMAAAAGFVGLICLFNMGALRQAVGVLTLKSGHQTPRRRRGCFHSRRR